MKRYQFINTLLQMKLIFRCICTVVSLLFLISCEEETHQPISSDGSEPAIVTVTSVESLPGGANIIYTLPQDRNFMYVIAEVTEPDGKKLTFNSSSYTGNIKILGLGTAESHEVKLYSVSKGNVKSEPVIVPIAPLTPPYISVLESLKYRETFGGVNIQFVNELRAECSITLGVINDKKGFEEYGTAYVRDALGNYSWHGLENKETKFGLYIRDRWNHYSDTIQFTLTPLFEEEIDKSTFKAYRLPGDGPFFSDGGRIVEPNLWDGTWSVDITNPFSPALWKPFGTSVDPSDRLKPTHFTIDLGAKRKLSRLRVNHYYPFQNSAPKYFEVWGSEDTPPSEGSWDGWTKLADMENLKPSGLPVGQIGAGDAEAYAAGTNANFDINLPSVRYIRFRCIESWSGTGHLEFAEVTFYGSNVVE
ncbi:DUF5000 domain-containing lipoprotein [Bacteroides sp.]|uniref:DUF5000 domain-containing lipoprotein n=1 Tax=Bacteroides sp. TaxID=29523 RepID=UPI00262F3202|nr:DUF5000 domain-containing lipoprotein [Bacteroides sp.]MDD3038017.1 DUF5000 domain-containing lipoprotein [Bacteroides sp.]